ncbi:MAG: phosphopantothenoylcysteine decarboxylase/phosphopantothenate/cysteine ligase [Gemmatimonadetes bacterium]|nr:phosphopantothenoylcysteine decarboxylase/phosphopantothenate/cysteine ligase [Gemmatimonadota bacterium]
MLLGITGGIASYKSAWLARLLTQAGAEVDVVMTVAASQFVGPITFEALTGRPAHLGLFDPGHALEHIRLAREAHAFVVAPATADFLARASTGQADDLLSAALLATTAPVLLVPAMNDRMWANGQVQRNVAHLRELGHTVLEPDEGNLAVGEGHGPGRMPEPEALLSHVGRLLEEHRDLAGRHVLVTAGPTQEPLDPVRYISNHSSGKMGVAIAAAAWRRGAHVTLIAGPLAVPVPVGARVLHVATTEEMLAAVTRELPASHVLVMAAAPADFRATSVADQKMKKGAAAPVVALEHTPDILKSTKPARAPGTVVVGFALETERVLENAAGKLAAKELDMIVVNDATEAGAGFGHDTNRVALVRRSGDPEQLPLMPKTEVADAILDRVALILQEKAP